MNELFEIANRPNEMRKKQLETTACKQTSKPKEESKDSGICVWAELMGVLMFMAVIPFMMALLFG